MSIGTQYNSVLPDPQKPLSLGLGEQKQNRKGGATPPEIKDTSADEAIRAGRDSEIAPVILVVDDDQLTRKSLEHFLKRTGFTVLLAEGGREALEKMSDNVAVVLLDLLMPDLSGLDCLRRFRRDYPDTQVVMLSGVGEIQDAVTAMKEGAFEYLTKPWNEEELLARLRQAAQIWQLIRDNRRLRRVLETTGDESLGMAGMTLAEIERLALLDTLKACNGSRAGAARMLGLSEKTIYNKIKRYGLRGKA